MILAEIRLIDQTFVLCNPHSAIRNPRFLPTHAHVENPRLFSYRRHLRTPWLRPGFVRRVLSLWRFCPHPRTISPALIERSKAPEDYSPIPPLESPARSAGLLSPNCFVPLQTPPGLLAQTGQRLSSRFAAATEATFGSLLEPHRSRRRFVAD